MTEALLTEVAARLTDRADELVARQLAALRALPAYDPVPGDDLRRSCRRNVHRVVSTLTGGETLADIEEDEHESGRRRAHQGVPSDAVVEAYRTVLGILRDAFIEEATAGDADPGAVLAGTTALWDLTDRNSGVLVSARHRVEIDAARQEERRRIVLVQRLLGGSLHDDELVEAAGMLADRDYWVVRARDDGQRLARHLELQDRRALVAPFDGDVAALLTRRPEPIPDAVLAVAGPVPLRASPAAFAEATRVLAVALRHGRTGVLDGSALSVRVAVEQEREIGEQLYRRYVAPLGGAGGASVLGTVSCWLHHRRSVPATALSLSVHENTVRYRLSRFGELVGADLADTDVLVEVWWALEHSALRDE